MSWTKVARTQITGLAASGTADNLGTWNVGVDLSSFVTVPSGATGVLIEYKQDSSSARYVGIRETGQTAFDELNGSLTRGLGSPVLVALRGGTAIDLYLQNTTDVTFFILGFTGAETVFFTRSARPVIANNGGSATWADRDLSADIPSGAVAALVSFFSTFKWRPNGSSVDRDYGAQSASGCTIPVPLDSNRILEIAKVTSDVSIAGYMTSGVTFAYDTALPTTADGTARDSGIPNPGKLFAFGVHTGASGNTYYTRENGLTHTGSFTGSNARRGWIAALDAGGEFELAMESASPYPLKLDGWIDGPAGAVPTISNAGDEGFFNGEGPITIDCTNAGGAIGSGAVIISPNDNISDPLAVVQTATFWSDTLIQFTAIQQHLLINAPGYLFIRNNAGDANEAGYLVTFKGRGPIVPTTTLRAQTAATAGTGTVA